MTRLTTGSNPLFAVKNAMRDFQQSVNTGTWGVTYADGIVKWVRAFAEVASESDLFKEWQDMGGGNNTMYRADDQRDVNMLMDDLAPEKGTKATLRRAGKRFLNAITLERLNEIVENTSRFAEYRYGKHDLSTFEGRQKAFIASQDVTVDFSEHGAGNVVTVMNRVVPFANATMQGLNKDINLVRDLIGTRSTKEQRAAAAEKLGKTVLNTGLLAALQWALVDGLFGGDDDDEEEYGLLSDEMKAGNIVFKLPKALTDKLGFDRPWVRIPIAQGVIQRSLWTAALNITGDVANMDEMTLDMRKMANSILWDALPSGSIISGWIDATNNKTYYGGQIVSDSALKRSAPNQYNADTIDAFRSTSRGLYNLGIEISPAVMQYMFEQYGGIIGKIAIPATSGNKYTGEWTPLDSLKNVAYSIAKNYTIDPVTSTDITNNYKDAKTLLTQISYDAKNGDPVNDLPLVLSDSEMDDAIKDAQSAMKKGGFIYETDKQVSELWDQISDIQNSDAYSDGEKALKIRELRREMDYVEQEGLAEYAEYLMRYGIKDSILKQIMSVIKPK